MNPATGLAPDAFTPPLPRGAIVASIVAHAAALLLLPGLQRSADDVQLPPIIASLRLVAPVPAAVQASPASAPAATEHPAGPRPRHATPEVHRPAPMLTASRPETPAFTVPALQPAAGPERIAREEAPAPQPTASAPAAAPQLSVAQENLALDDYGRALSDLLARQQQYPRLAALRGWEGEVRLRLRVARKGNLVAVQVVHSSGHEILDQHALQLVQDAALPTPPSALGDREIQVVVPIHYKLQKPT